MVMLLMMANAPKPTFCIAFYIFVTEEHRDFKLGTHVDHIKPQMSVKGAWLCYVTHFTFFCPIHTSERAEARVVKFCT